MDQPFTKPPLVKADLKSDRSMISDESWLGVASSSVDDARSPATGTSTSGDGITRSTVNPIFNHIHRTGGGENEFFQPLPLPETRARLVKRNMPHFQSLNKVAVTKSARPRLVRSPSMPTHMRLSMQKYFHRFLPDDWLSTHWSLFQRDWFHTFLRWPTMYSLLLLVIGWTISILFFALIYLGSHRAASTEECKFANGIHFGYMSAFAFSLQTSTTVGYTLPPGTNFFFQHCPGAQTAIYFQMLFSLLFDAFFLAFLFARIARSETRATQVLFGNKAILKSITYDDGKGDGPTTRWTFEVRIFDLDASHPVVEAHVRLYASFLPENQHLQVCRLLRPDDSYNGWVYTSVPYTVVHEIDIYSPLAPPAIRKLRTEHKRWFVGWNGLERRDADSRTEASMGWICPICAQGSGELPRLIRHIEYMKAQDKAGGMPIEGTHQEVPDDLLQSQASYMNKLNEDLLRKHLRNVEIICVVEGIDPITSGTFQALQSYTIDDMVFGGSFRPCVRFEDDGVVVDLDSFHKTIGVRKQQSSDSFYTRHLKDH